MSADSQEPAPVMEQPKLVDEKVIALGDSPEVGTSTITTKVSDLGIEGNREEPGKAQEATTPTAFVGWTPYLRPKSMASNSSTNSTSEDCALQGDDKKLALQTKIGQRPSISANSPPQIREPLSATHLSPPLHRQFIGNVPSSAPSMPPGRFYQNSAFHRPISYPAPLAGPASPLQQYSGVSNGPPATNQQIRSPLSANVRGTFQNGAARPVSEFGVPGQSWKSAESEAIDRFFEDLTYYERTLSSMAQAKSDDSFREELAAVEQWFAVLSEPERTTCLFSLVQHSSPMQVKFFMTVFAQMAQYDPISASVNGKAAGGVPVGSSSSSVAPQGAAWSQRRSEVAQSWAPGTEENFEKSVDDGLLMQQLRLSSSLARNRRLNDRHSAPNIDERYANYMQQAEDSTIVAGEFLKTDGEQNGSATKLPTASSNATAGNTHSGRFPINSDKRASYHPESLQASDMVAAADRMRNRLSLDVNSALSSAKAPSSANVINAANWSYFASTPVSAGPPSIIGGKFEGESHVTGTSLRPGLTIDTYQNRHGGAVATKSNRRANSTVNSIEVPGRTAAAIVGGNATANKLDYFRPRSAGPSLGPQIKFTKGGPPPPAGQNVKGNRNSLSLLRGQADFDVPANSMPTTPFGYGDAMGDFYMSPNTAVFSPNTMNAVQIATRGVQQMVGQPGAPAGRMSVASFAPSATSGMSSSVGASTFHGKQSLGQSPSPTNAPKDKAAATVDVDIVKDIPTWLRTLRLHKYTECFKDLTWKDMVTLSEDDLEKRGVTAQGARRKLIKVFDMVKSELDPATENLPEGEEPESKTDEQV